MAKNMNRRDFLKGAAVSALGMATLGAMPMAAVAEEAWDIETEVLVVGAGGAGVRYVMDRPRYEHHLRDSYTINGEPARFSLLPADEASPADLVLLAVKYPQLEGALDTMASSIRPGTIVLSLMNGVTSEKIVAERFPQARVVTCVAQGMDAMRRGTSLVYTVHGELHVGVPEDARTPQLDEALDEVCDLLARTKTPFVREKDINYRLWFKYMLNVGINQSCMVFGVGYGEATTPGTEACAINVAAMREVREVAAHEGVTLTEADVAHCLELEARLDPQATPSMGQDRLAGRPSEVDMFAGTMVELGRRFGVLVPANAWLLRRVRQIEEAYPRG